MTLSIVMPCHNTFGKEENFRKTLMEIRGEEVQLILALDRVDQISSNRLLEIIDSFPGLDYELISGNYGSPGATRNAGLKLVKGDWLTFWDFDDVPKFQQIKIALAIASNSEYDCVVGCYATVNTEKEFLTENHPLGASFLQRISSNPGIWRFVFSKKSVGDLTFPALRMGEDQVFIGEYFANSPRILVSESIFYQYYIGDPNQTTKQKRLLWDLLTSSELLLRVINDKTARNRALIAKLVFRQLITGVIRGEVHLKIKAVIKLSRNWWVVPLSMRTLIERKILVHLTGGLGNQLFQYAAAQFLSKGNGLSIETTLGKPRLSKNGAPEIFSYNLPNTWTFQNQKVGTPLVAKILGYKLRMGVKPGAIEKFKMFQKIMNTLAMPIISLYIRSLVRAEGAKGVGYSNLSLKPNRTNYLIGSFQSYKWASDPEVFAMLKKLRSKDWNSKIENWLEISKIENPLVVHFRLGDYKSEKTFGNLDRDYYYDAINLAWNTGKYNKIWIFSDELELAKDIFDIEILEFARWIDTSDETSANVLEIMRMGLGYVIANSTFSWWGAFLSHSDNPDVIAPFPWFKGEDEPVDLIPPTWKRLSAKWS